MDATHPMIALPGHTAFIAPNYAASRIGPQDLGVHRLMSGGSWSSVYGKDVAQMLRVHPGLVLAVARLRRLLSVPKET